VDGVTYPASVNAPTNVGSYTVTASLAADSNHLSATSTSLNFSISAIPLSIAAKSQTKVYGTSLSLGSGQTNFTALGLTNSDTIGTVTLSSSGGTQSTDSVGSYTLTPSLATGGTFKSSNYSITYLAGTLSVTPTNSTISVSGSTNFNYSGYAQGPTNTAVVGSSAIPVLRYASVDGVTYPASVSAPTNVGNYTVTASLAADFNHLSATSTPLSFHISATPLTVTASDLTKIYDTSIVLGVSSIGFTVTGLVGSDVVNSVTLSASGGTADGDPLGIYSVTPSSAVGMPFTAANYNISYISGQLIVTNAPSGNATGDQTEVPLLNSWGIAALLAALVGMGMRASRRSN